MSQELISSSVRRIVLLALTICCCLSWQSPGAMAASPVGSAAAQVSASVDPFMASELSEYAGRQLGPFVNGSWADPQPLVSWACNEGGPATAAATLYVVGGESDATYLKEAEETINTAIADHQVSNGSFVPPAGDSESVGITTAWFAAEEGTVYHLLAPYVDSSTKAAWKSSIEAAAQWLVTDGDVAWYANGNINSVYVEVEWLAWAASGQQRFLTYYNEAWSDLMDPDQAKFPGDGWITAVAPTQSNGSDGRGYFAEGGDGGTGWDPYYSMLQLDAMARLYLVSGDSRALQAMNMLWNQEWPRENTTTWMFDQSDGTRHTGNQGTTGFLDSAMFVMALEDHRTGLIPDLMPYLRTYEGWYASPQGADSASYRRAFGNSIATIALAAALASPAQQALVSGYGLLGSDSATTSSVGTARTPATTPVGSIATGSGRTASSATRSK